MLVAYGSLPSLAIMSSRRTCGSACCALREVSACSERAPAVTHGLVDAGARRHKSVKPGADQSLARSGSQACARTIFVIRGFWRASPRPSHIQLEAKIRRDVAERKKRRLPHRILIRSRSGPARSKRSTGCPSEEWNQPFPTPERRRQARRSGCRSDPPRRLCRRSRLAPSNR